VSLNTPDAMRVGSVGRPLPHVRIREVGRELMVSGSAMLGYVDQPETWGAADVATGDLGRIDDSGYIHVDGRAGNLIITSFGRNVSPEWPESELLASPLISQAVVIGNARPWCSALLVPLHRQVSDEEIDAAVRRANNSLPDYARIANWCRLPAPLTVADELLTSNGRPRRTAIETRYRAQIEELYEPQPEAINQ
jgi:long-subunit acyl-CoA synthetase (AMP-forming)